MSDKLKKKLKNFIIGDISEEENLDESYIDESLNTFRGMPLFATLNDEDFEFVANEIKSEFSIRLDKGLLIEEKGHEKWFLDRKRDLDMKYWERYKKYLLYDKGFSTTVVNKTDDILDTITDLLGDPERNVSYSRKGLVIGDVQSGKTANYIGLINKAADAGYKVIVLLTGTIEKLRQQTQKRIDEGFVGMDSDAMMKQKESGLIVGVGRYDSSVIKPVVLTSTTADFKQQNAKNLNFDLNNINGPVVFVVKKNSAVLKRLNKWLTTFNQNGEQPINHSLLMIDDESDNASVNTKSEDNPTAINAQLRLMLKAFTKSSYIGFTATPFANIFIDPDSETEMQAEDLFPRDYIYSLNAPSNYIGARNIFGENGNNSDMLVPIFLDYDDPGSVASILPIKHKSDAYIDELPDDLRTSIRTFLLANTVEDVSNCGTKHRSMLINVSRFTRVQNQIGDLVNDYLKDLQNSCKLYCRLSEEEALNDNNINDLKETYEEIYRDINYPWIEIQKNLYGSCANIIVQLFNKDSGHNFDFDSFPNGARIIAVGGMSLSRGLTLEGLVISYFYRNSKMYDTLMQMGRWFGYREKYQKLCKIWMTEESIEWYRYISDATDELRDEVKSYEDSGLTPLDFGLRVRSDLTSLIVTAANKMRSADSRECLVSLSGEVIETPELYSDVEKNKKNMDAIDALIDSIVYEGNKVENFSMQNKKLISGFRDVSKSLILDFLGRIEVSPKNIQFNINSLLKFLREYMGTELETWDVVFATGDSEKDYSFSNGISGRCKKLKYSLENDGKIIKMSGSKRRIGSSGDGRYGLDIDKISKIKAKCYPKEPKQKDFFRGINRNPLLIIYPLELGELVPNNEGNSEELMTAIQDNIYVGFSVGIPSLNNVETMYIKYVLNKVAIQNMFEGELEEWNSDEEGED